MSESLDLEPIKARAAAATDEPWQIIEDRYEPCDRPGAYIGMVAQRRIFTGWDHPQMHGPLGVVNSYVTVGKVQGQQPHHGVSISAEDAAFIAAARSDIPALIAEVERLRQELDTLKPAPAVDASDPPASRTGKLSTRVKETS